MKEGRSLRFPHTVSPQSVHPTCWTFPRPGPSGLRSRSLCERLVVSTIAAGICARVAESLFDTFGPVNGLTVAAFTWLLPGITCHGRPQHTFPGFLSSLGFPYIIEVEYDGSAVLRQPFGMEFTPANNVLLCLFPRDLRPRHLAGESAHEPRAVSLHDSTMSKGEVRRVIVLFREIYSEYRSRLGECHLAPALRPVPGSVYHSHGRSIRFVDAVFGQADIAQPLYLSCVASAPARLS